MNSLAKISFIIPFLLFPNHLPGQPALGKPDSINIQNFSEEVYVQTDRDYYFSGERIWMKLYKLDRLNSVPANESKVIYLELMDNTGNIIRQLKISVDGYSASADLRLPDTLRTGNYLIRAYTSWMQNYSEDLFFYRYISVINPFLNIERLVKSAYDFTADSLSFFPEGGRLVPGIRNRIGVRCTDIAGDPVKIEGEILNQRGDTLTRFGTGSTGFGLFTLYPSGQDRYEARFRTSGNIQHRQMLPGISDEGRTLLAEISHDNAYLKIRILGKRDPGAPQETGIMTLISGGLIILREEINFATDSTVILPMSSLPGGSSLISLSDISGNKISERWIYNDGKLNLALAVRPQERVYSARQKAVIDILVTDKPGIPAIADLSVSVVKSCLAGSNRTNITTRYENNALPGRWISGLEAHEMNDMMLSYSEGADENGNLMKQKNGLALHLPELGGQLISGILKNRQNHEPLKNTDISLSFVGKVARCQFLKTDTAGKFNFPVNWYGQGEIVIQPLKPVSSGSYVEFNQPFSTTFIDHKPPSFSLDSAKADEINKAIVSMQVNKIYEPFRSHKEKTGEAGDAHDFFGDPENKIILSDYIELTTVREVIKEIVPELTVIKRNKDYFFRMVNIPSSSSENPPLVLVDGVPFYNIGKLLDVSSKEIERIDILNSRYFYSDYIFDGIVSFITKKGNLSSMEYDNSVFRQVYEGCQEHSEFYSPDYTSRPDSTLRIPDFRNTLYWKHDLHTDTDGKATISFFTSDEPGEYIITIEGITPEGNTGFLRVPFSVK